MTNGLDREIVRVMIIEWTGIEDGLRRIHIIFVFIYSLYSSKEQYMDWMEYSIQMFPE